MKTLIGSRAMNHWFPDFRVGKDEDYLTDEDLKSTLSPHVEYFNVNGFHGLEWVLHRGEIASPEILYTIKLSHSFWNVHWPKTMFDILWCQNKGIEHIPELLSLLYKDWEIKHGKKKAYLGKSNDDFFNDFVSRVYVHDDIHRAIAYYDEPMFEKLKYRKDSAYISEKLFNGLSYEDKLKTCREEIYVTTLERFLIPSEFRMNSLTAYRGACKLLVTSMTKGWFPRFIVLNWSELNRPDHHNYIDLFKSANLRKIV